MVTENLFELLSLTDLDKLIDTRLKKAGIVLFEVDMTAETSEEIILKFKKDFLLYHPLTIRQCILFTIDPMTKVFSKVEKIPEEYFGYIYMIKGYTEARNEVVMEDLIKRFTEPSPYLEKLNNIFSKEKFMQVSTAVKNITPQFQKAAAECQIDFARDRTVENEQLGFITDFVQELSNEKSTSDKKDIAGKMSEKLMNIASKVSRPAAMELWTQSHRNKIWGTPLDRLIIAYTKLISYWQLLHHAGYVKLSADHDEKWVKYL